ncbi:MAG TPA: hydroxymethylglutaryl-CoA reductase, degradative [Bacilli bacterium]
MNSAISKFYELPLAERLQKIAAACGLDEAEVKLLTQFGSLTAERADAMIENAIGVIPIPLGIAVNFTIDEKDVFVPMAVEEPSVIAAASHAAKLARAAGGFWTTTTGDMMYGQIQLVHVADPYNAAVKVYEHKEEILAACNAKHPTLAKLGGGARGLETRIVNTDDQAMLVVHILVDTKDAMGANIVNSMAEAVSPMLESITEGKAVLRILSNLSDRRLVRVRAVFRQELLGGPQIVQNIIHAQKLAEYDPYRAATHNKGIMNGVSSVVLATGNDTRAIEAGAHAYACRSGQYRALTRWEKNQHGDLVGSLEIPLALGIVGGATKSHPIAQIALKIMGVKTADELARVVAAAGLAQNLSALRALASEGIQKGHMALHARNLAIMAGADPSQIDAVVRQATSEQDVRFNRIVEIVKQMNEQR